MPQKASPRAAASTSTQVSGGDVPPEILALIDKPLEGSQPPDWAKVTEKLDEVLEPRFEEAKRTLASYTPDELESMDADQALKILTLREKLDAARKQKAASELEARSKVAQLKEVERQLEERRANQDGCARTGHSRENGTSAIGGQRDSQGIHILTCQRCHRVHRGVGDGPGQLPMHMANRIDWDNVGS